MYDETKPLPPPFDMTYLPFDDTVFVPDDKMPALSPVTLPQVAPHPDPYTPSDN